MADRQLLVIDDDRGFVELVVEYFSTAGYDIRSASNLEDAVQSYRTQKSPVVLLDFNMPMVNGDKFFPILKTMNPAVRVIVVTGCLEEEVQQRFKDLPYFAFFQKGNLSLEKLKEKVNEALATT